MDPISSQLFLRLTNSDINGLLCFLNCVCLFPIACEHFFPRCVGKQTKEILWNMAFHCVFRKGLFHFRYFFLTVSTFILTPKVQKHTLLLCFNACTLNHHVRLLFLPFFQKFVIRMHTNENEIQCNKSLPLGTDVGLVQKLQISKDDTGL